MHTLREFAALATSYTKCISKPHTSQSGVCTLSFHLILDEAVKEEKY